MRITGKLAEHYLPEILKTINLKAQSGTLLVRRDATEKKLYFDKGRIVSAASNLPEDGLGKILVKIGKLSPYQLEQISQAPGSAKHLGKILMEKAIFQPAQISEFLELQAQEIIFPLFDWNIGEFEFRSGTVSLDAELRLNLSMSNLILEGVRRIKNPEIILKGLKGTETVIRPGPQFETKIADLILKPDEAFILSRIESPAKISEILQVSPLGLETTQRTLYGLISTGIIEFVNPKKRPSASTPRLSGTNRPHKADAVPLSCEPSEKEDSGEDLEALRSEILLMLENTKSKNYYDLFQLSFKASPEEIKKAYYTLAKKYHPDHYHRSNATDLKNALDIIFSALTQAYDTLKVPATRASYDAKLSKLEGTPTKSSENPIAAQTSVASSEQQKLTDFSYRQGRAHFDQEDYFSAIQAFRQSLRLEPENARYRYWLAMSLTKTPKGRREAEEHFLKAIELEPFNPSHYIGLGLLYREVGMLTRAESQLRQALKVAPGNKAAEEALKDLRNSKREILGLQSLKNLFRKK